MRTAIVMLAAAASMLTAAADTGEWKQLFNGKDLSGWQHVGPGGLTVEDGVIHTRGGMGLTYWTGGKVGDCVIKIVYRMRDENDNSGVFIRIPSAPTEPWMPVNKGYEVQIDNHPERGGEDDYHVTGTLYSLTKPIAKPGKPGPEWNTMEITLDGPHTIVTVNGEKVTDYTEGNPGAAEEAQLRTGPGPETGSRIFWVAESRRPRHRVLQRSLHQVDQAGQLERIVARTRAAESEPATKY